MENNGRPGALPELEPPRRPPNLDGLVVTHIGAKGEGIAVYDFGQLSLQPAFQTELAQLFSSYARPAGRWGSIRTSGQAFWSLKYFATWLSSNGYRPSNIEALTPATWLEFRLAKVNQGAGLRAIGQTRRILKDSNLLSVETRAEVLRRLPREKKDGTSYSDDELRRIVVAARRVFRAARQRIKKNLQVLERYRHGEYEPGSAEHAVGEALEIMLARADLPRRWNRTRSWPIYEDFVETLGGGGPESTWKRLYLSEAEVFAAIVLIASKEGWNATSIAELQVPTRVDGTSSGLGNKLLRVELEKRRRRPPHRYETRTLEDSGADSTARLLKQIMEVTQPGRDALASNGLATDRLFVYRRFVVSKEIRNLLRVGMSDNAPTRFEAVTNIGVSLRRIRKAVNSRHRREPNQNSQDTHDSVYTITDPHTIEASQVVIARGVTNALEHAINFVPVVREEDGDAGEDTPTASCIDREASPFSPWGVPCSASFMLCLACHNALVMPKHLGRLAHLYESLTNLQQSMPPEFWESEWARHYLRLRTLRTEHYSDAQWQVALSEASDTDKAVIDRLLRGELDA